MKTHLHNKPEPSQFIFVNKNGELCYHAGNNNFFVITGLHEMVIGSGFVLDNIKK